MRLDSPTKVKGTSRQPASSGRPSGPVHVPRRRRGVPLLGWIMVGVVTLLALLLYIGTRQYAPSPLNAPPPTWGPLTLAQVAVRASRAAGEVRPTGAVWVSTLRMDAVPYLTGRSSSNPEADFLVALRGHFHASGPVGVRLPGSLLQGNRLVLLVRGFDGHVTGLMITDRPLARLRGLGIVHPLSLGLGLL